MKLIQILIVMNCFFSSCSSKDSSNESGTAIITEDDDTISDTENNAFLVQNVSITGQENNYSFSVTLLSPDTGCDQYADWWEVITEAGDLIYRRILTHSHVNEQPFTRSGTSINITANQTVIIRAHMNNLGYGTTSLKGSVENGFETTEIATDFALNLLEEEPLPESCAF